MQETLYEEMMQDIINAPHTKVCSSCGTLHSPFDAMCESCWMNEMSDKRDMFELRLKKKRQSLMQQLAKVAKTRNSQN
jgi:hypothetical protein